MKIRRTTINLPVDLLEQSQKVALQRKITFTSLVKDALLDAIARGRKPKTQRRKARLPTYGSSGARPGVDLNNTASLLDLMDKDDLARR